MAFTWTVTPNQAFPELYENYTKTIFLTGRRVAEQRAKTLEQWAKDNAIWQDRTGEARAGLKAEVRESPGVLAEIVLKHTAKHGLWLEIANGGRYAIIARAIDVQSVEFMRDIQRIMNLKLATGG